MHASAGVVPQVGCGLGIDGTFVGRGVGGMVGIEQIRSRSFWSGGGHVGIGTVVGRGAIVGAGVSVAIRTTAGKDVGVDRGAVAVAVDVEGMSALNPEATERSPEPA
jgi:hypothetical protein